MTGRIASLPGKAAWVARVLYGMVRHPVDGVRYWRACVVRRHGIAAVVRESLLCPDCVDTEGLCDYHMACIERVMHDEYGYMPDAHIPVSGDGGE